MSRNSRASFWRNATCLRCSAARWFILLLIFSLTAPGCGGCQKQQQSAGGKGKGEAKSKKDGEEKLKNRDAERPALELGRFQIQPTDEDSAQYYLKPGHWTSTLHAMRANQEDVQADFESVASNKNGIPLQLERTPFRVNSSRPVALPKGQNKAIETFYFVPRDAATGTDTRLWLQRRLVPRMGARREILDQQPCMAMPDYQFYFVVLANDPDRYAFLKSLHSVAPPRSQVHDDARDEIVYYRVLIPKNMERGAPLPSNPMAWTGTAYILWDNIYPNVLNPLQQQAMIDWLHWGGQIMISGPGSLERLKGSFLEPYLPATSAGAVELAAADFEELDANWSLPLRQGETQVFPINASEKILGADLQLASHGTFVEGCGRLVSEGPVGNGRIVISAFPLIDRRALSWKSFDGFFNGCLLRRPNREYKKDPLTTEPELVWADLPSLIRDPLLVSRLRYLSRDATNAAPVTESEATLPADSPQRMSETWRLAGYASQPHSGIAAWNDMSSVSKAARDTLKQAAGITIPESKFVLRVLAIYLFALVPVNWAFFRLIGRVEWAWVAAPIMGIVASVAVVRLAQLDIGFARSRTEIATLEVHGGYPRGHLSRYTALYTSLTTNYEVESESDSAVILPFSTDPEYQPRLHDRITSVSLRRDRAVRLSGFPVISNSTGIVHSEQMYDLGGSIELTENSPGDWQLANSSDMEVMDAVILRRTLGGELELARLGSVRSKVSVPVSFQVTDEDLKISDLWPESPVMSGRNLPASEAGLQMFADIVVQQLPLRAGESRLVGWSEQAWKGFAVRPEANQTIARTLVLVHLDTGPLPPARMDKNLLLDVVDEDLRKPLTDEDVEAIEILPVDPER